MADTPATIDDYIDTFPADVQAILEKVRRTIRKGVPEAEETIGYGIPAFTVDGRALVYLAGWKHHIAVYPVPAGDEAFEQELAPYRSGKATLKFPTAKPIPYDLIGQVVALLVKGRADGD